MTCDVTGYDPGIIERSALCLAPSKRASFKSACQSGDTHTIEAAVKQFFSTWTNSLMGDDLQRLEDLSRLPDICSHIKTICIEDDSKNYDPWNVSEPPQADSTNLWPRNDQGIVDAELPGVMSLKRMLLEQRLKPTTIKIQDYCISDANSLVFPDTLGHHHIGAIQPVTTLARNIVENTDLVITSIILKKTDIDLSPNSWLFLPHTEQVAICNPDVREMVLELSPQAQGKDVGFAQLHTARMSSGIDPWWLEQISNHAVMLQELELLGPSSLEAAVSTPCAFTQLKQLGLSHLSVRAETIISIIAGCKDQLATITLRSITLINESTWSTLLSILGADCTNLTSFQVVLPREESNTSTSGKVINFFGMKNDALAEEERDRLKIDERGPAENRRCNRVYYDGPNAAKVLTCLATYAA